MAYATAYNPTTKVRKKVLVDDPNAFAGGFQLETKAPKAAPTADPMTDRVRRALALEGDLVKPDEFGIPDLESKLKTGREQYRSRYLAGFDLPDMVRQEAEARTPTLKLDRSGIEAKYADPKYADPNSESYIPPGQRQALINQDLTGGREYLSRVTDKVGRLYQKDVDASRMGLEDLGSDLDRATGQFSDRLGRARALLGEEKAADKGERDFLRSLAFSQTGLEGGVAPDEVLGPVGSPLRRMFEGLSTESRRQRKIAERPKSPGIQTVMGGIWDRAAEAGYQRIPNDAGGFTYVGPDGKAIPVTEFTQATGMPLTKALEGSTDQGDVSFLKRMTTAPSDSSVFEDELSQFMSDYAGLKGKERNQFKMDFMRRYPTRAQDIEDATSLAF